MSFKIPCGGFKLDEKSFSLDENGVLSVSGGGGGGVQPDWNQNDSTATDYIKNRPFYTGNPSETVLVEDSTVEFVKGDGSFYVSSFPSTFKAIFGETYKVSWDGTVYECVCENVSGLPSIGNKSIASLGPDTGEPFVIFNQYGLNEQGWFSITKDTSASHMISISGSIAEVIQIPDKYISDTFRDVVIAGDPLNWSENDWTKYYGLFENGKLLMINGVGSSNSEGYVLSMAYSASSRIHRMSAINFNGDFYKLDAYQDGEENKFCWAPIISYDAFYFQYNKTGSGNSEAYKRLEVADGLAFTTKNANEDAVMQKVVLEGDKEIILSSSTSGSTKKFKITVDDSGTLSATEVT